MSISKRRAADLYAGVELFAGCTKRDLARIASLSTPVSVPAGKVLCVQGAPGREAFVVVNGEASVDIDGREISVIGPGGFFGEMALLDHGPRVATVTARTPMELLVLTVGEFRSLLRASSGVAVAVLTAVVGRLRRVESEMGAGVPTGV